MKTYLQFINESKNYQHSVGPLFHGSGHKFDIFDFNKLGEDGHLLSFLGMHFTENEDVAENFVNPPDYIFYEVELKYNKFLEIKESDLVKNMLRFGVDNKILDLEINFDLPYYGTSNDILGQLQNLSYEKAKETSLKYKSHLIKQEYDSIKYINEIEMIDIKRWDWIIFEPEQIKILKTWDQKPTLKIK